MSYIDFSNFCIITNVKENLESTMEVKLYGTTYKVAICADKAEEVTIKNVKEALKNRLDKIDMIIEEAESYGLKVYRPGEEPAPKAKRPPQPSNNGAVSQISAEPIIGNSGVISENTQPTKTIESMSEIQVKNHELGEFEAPMGGGARKITKRVEDDTGTTTYNFVKTSNADIVKGKYDNRSFSNESGYAVSDCGQCRGAGLIRLRAGDGSVSERQCPKCKGTGIKA